MKVIHTSDWHLGRKFYEHDLSDSFVRWGEFLVDLAREEKADAVLISGDLYDRGIPPVQMIALLEEILAQLLEFTQVVITSGNHDSPQRLGFASRFLREGLYIQTNSRNSGKPITLRKKDGELGAIVYGIPYLDPDVERVQLAPANEVLDRSHQAVVARACELVRTDIESGAFANRDIPRILMAHAFVTGSEKSDSEIDLSIGGIESVPSNLFRLGARDLGPLDYVALGHLHGPQKVGVSRDPLMRYSGSPIPFSFSEEQQTKSTVVLDFSTSHPHAPQIKLIPHTFFRKLKTLRGTMSELLNSRQFDAFEDAYVRLEVTDIERPRDLVATLRRRFPYLVQVTQSAAADLSAIADQESLCRQPLEVIQMFFEESGGRKLSSAELALIREIWEETGAAEANRAEGEDK